MTKQELLGAMNAILNNYLLGMLMTRVTRAENWTSQKEEIASFQGPPPLEKDILTVNVKHIIQGMLNPSSNRILVIEFENVLKRALVSEGHEAILNYCEQSNQFPKYKATPWFQFARIIRNVVSHKTGGILQQWPGDLTKAGVTSVTWRHKTIDIGMVGKEVTATHYDVLKLYSDQLVFAEKELV